MPNIADSTKYLFRLMETSGTMINNGKDNTVQYTFLKIFGYIGENKPIQESLDDVHGNNYL